MYPSELIVFTSQDLIECTNNFNQNNFIGFTQLGRFFRGNIHGQHVSLKILDNEKLECLSSKNIDKYLIIKASIIVLFSCNLFFNHEEVKFWINPVLKGHHNLVSLIGYCWEEDVKGVVYDLNSLDTLHTIMMKDSLNWIQRINVIYELAMLLKFIHDQDKQNMALNISASHILLDKDYKPKLFDLVPLNEVKMLKEQLTMSTCYIDPYFSMRGGEWNRSCEVFSFGIVLLELLTKRVSNIGRKEEHASINLNNLLHIWAKNEYKPNCSLVHKNLQEDWNYCAIDGVAITQLAMQCIEFFPSNRPSMSDVILSLENLSVFQRLDDVRPIKREKNFI
ncbi:hypothetical protein Lal_00018662 [Lupinus albus]|nr:hypothetical protein Lal_00018662 [Lupinus albus]